MLRFTVPGQMPGLNELEGARGEVRHRLNPKTGKRERFSHAYNDLKQQWTGTVALFCPPAPPVAEGEQEIVFLRVFEPSWRRDSDNVLGGARKMVHDGLVVRGLVKNDGAKYICPVVFGVVNIDKDKPRTVVTVLWRDDTQYATIFELAQNV